MNRRPSLGIESLEDRSLPATWGVPWADPGHLTLSFTPDGTATPAGPSTLNALLAGAGGAAAQKEVLRAFQTWAAAANINIGVVADAGLPLGTPGAVQGDSRFGDIRLVAEPTGAADELATASPFSWSGSTLAGDVTLDSTDPFTVGGSGLAYDLFTVFAHEAGHALGLDHSADPGSVMGEGYAYKTTLTAGDVANIQALYGARSPDQYDAVRPNGTLATATTLTRTPGLFTQFSATGDITTNSDVDFYKVSVPLGGLVTTVRLHAEGVSLLASAVTVYDARGRAIASAVATDPLNNDLTFTFLTPLPSTYYVKVAGATPDVFGVGGYQLVVDSLLSKVLPLAPLPALADAVPALDLHSNDAISGATKLKAKDQTDARFDYLAHGVVEDFADVDVYRVTAPKSTDGGAVNLNVVVWGTDPSPLNPRIKIYDQTGQPVAFQVLANDAGVMSVQIPNIVAGNDYYISVAASDPGLLTLLKGYTLAAEFSQDPLTTYQSVAGGDLAAGESDTGTLTASRAGLYQFALSADLMGAGTGAVTMTIVDASGNVVLAMDATAGQPAVTRSAFLDAGTYTVRYTYRATSRTAAPVHYGLFLMDLDDPIGPMRPSTAGATTSTSTSATIQPSGYTYTASSTTQTSSYGYSY